MLAFSFQICRNINRIKVCMETGQTVVLLNLENLYESLYDALNQVRLCDAIIQVNVGDSLNQVTFSKFCLQTGERLQWDPQPGHLEYCP